MINETFQNMFQRSTGLPISNANGWRIWGVGREGCVAAWFGRMDVLIGQGSSVPLRREAERILAWVKDELAKP